LVDGTIIYANSRTPTTEELTNCRHIVLTSDSDWDPQNVQLGSVMKQDTPKGDQVSIETTYRQSNIGLLLSISSVYDAESFERNMRAKTFLSKQRHSIVTPEEISDRWQIGLKQAKETLDATTQKYVRSALLPLSRRYRSDRHFYRNHLNHEFAADLYFGRVKSTRSNNCAFIFTNKTGFAVAYPQSGKSSALSAEALRMFTKDFGIPRKLTVDGALENVGSNSEFMKKKWFRVMAAKKVPKRLWDYGIVWVCEIMQRTTSSSIYADGRTPLEIITGETPDISEYLDFGFYDWVYYRDNAGLGETHLGRFLGVSHRVGNLMSYWVMSSSGRVVSRTTVQRVTAIELQDTDQRAKCKEFDDSIKERFKDENHAIQLDEDRQQYDWEAYMDDVDFLAEMEVLDNPDIPQAEDEYTNDDDYDLDADGNKIRAKGENKRPEPTPDSYDHYLNMELAMPRGPENSMEYAKVKRRVVDQDGVPVGVANQNPLLDTRQYEVEWYDGRKEILFANTIAENLFSQVDEDGNRNVILHDITDHRKLENEAMKEEDSYQHLPNGTYKRRATTKGWEILVTWKDGSTNWLSLKDVKDTYPVQLAEYAVANKLEKEPAFAWWVNYVLKKRETILSKIKTKYWLRTHKYGIEVPKSVEHAKELDRKNGNTLWWDAIMQEMKNVRIAFRKATTLQPPIGYQEIKCHMIFDVKLGENFRRKARYVAGGHVTEPPASITYSSVVSRESVRIALLIAALNDLEVLVGDIQNAYLHAPCREKIWCRAGPEFGSDEGSIMIIQRALYGLKSSGAAFRAMLAETLYEMGYKPTRGDPDVHIRPAIKSDNTRVYEYVLCYVDDIFCVSPNPNRTMDEIKKTFKFKGDEVKSPDGYLGASLSFTRFKGTLCWKMSSEKYVLAAITNVKEKLVKSKQSLKQNDTPFKTGYRPEMDDTEELNGEDITYFQELIGILRWAIELGRIDIALEVSMLSSHLALPRAGHLQAAYHIFGYLSKHYKRSLYFCPAYSPVTGVNFVQADWGDFYKEAKEEIPDDIPTPLGKPVEITCFVDADHAANKQTRRSQTGILIFINSAPISWYSKRQATVESSTFGSEFVAMRTAVEQIQALRLKLRWFGVPIDGPTNVFCDNNSVVTSTSQPEVTLSKKHNGIAYHKCREAVASKMIRVAHWPGDQNYADLLTKPLPNERRNLLLNDILA
jgi:hypothetical protein